MAEKVFDTTRDVMVGDQIMVYISQATAEGGTELKPIAYGTTCTLEMSADTIEASNKMAGNHKEYLLGQTGYTVSCEGLLSFREGHLSFQTLKKMMYDRVPVEFVIGTPDQSKDFANKKSLQKGRAFISSLSLTAENGSVCSSSMTLQGTGALEDVTNEGGGSAGTPEAGK